MTDSTTQLMLDIGELFFKPSTTQKTQIYQRLYSIFPTIFSFAFGCVIAAIVYKFAPLWLFIIAPILLILTYIYRENYKRA